MAMGDDHQGGASNMQSSAARKKAGSAAFPLSGVTAIKFGLLCTEEIVKLSVQSLQRHQQIGDPCLGLPHFQGDACSSCGGSTPDDCPGHFGHLDLASPVYSPGHLHKLRRILEGVCLYCGQTRKMKTKNRAAVLADSDERGDLLVAVDAPNRVPNKDIGHRTAMRKSRAKKESRDSTYVIISDDDEKSQHVLDENDQIFIDLASDLDVDNKDSIQAQANGGGCKYCSKHYPYPLVKVVLKPIKNECIQGLSLEYPGKGDMPPDYWKFMELGAASETSRTWDLLPSQVLALLKRIRANVMGLDDVTPPEAFILEAFPVSPNCLRPSANTVSTYFDLVGRDNGTTQLLKTLVGKNAVMKSARHGKPSIQAGASESEELQLHISRYMRFKGAQKVKGSAEPVVRGSLDTSNLSAIWKNTMKDSILGKMTHQCALAVLTGDPNLPIEELAIPQEIALQMTIPESVSVHNYDRLQAFMDSFKLEDAGAGFVERDSNLYDLSANESRKLELGDIVHRHLQEGDLCYANRTPSLHKHSVMAFKITIHPECTMKINPLVCSPFGADFDGDRLHVFLPQSLEARVETEELMALRKQLISAQNGDMLIGLSQDCLIAAYLLTADYIFFTALEMNQLQVHSQCDKALPPPAIIKSQRGALWTSLQAYSMLLPSTLTFSTERLLATDGEILQADDNPAWLRSSTRSLLYAIHGQIGVAAAIDYLNSCSMMLKELTVLEGFSIGLEDFSFRGDPGFCSKVGNVIESAKAYTSISNFQAAELDVEQLIHRHMKKGNAVGLMMKTGSKGSLSHLRRHVGCLGLQLYKKNEAVPGYCQFVKQSFWEGLDSTTFFHHSISSRDHILRQRLHLSEPGQLRDKLIKHLADAYIAYDGTVRYRHKQQVIRFNYRDSEGSVPKDGSFEGESVGVLAATAISQQASQTVLSAPQKASKYIDFFKETLQSNYKADVNENDRTIILRLKKCGAEDCRCLESRLLELQHHLQRVTLKDMTTNIVIEWTSMAKSPWLCHIHLSNEALQHFNLAVESISHSLGEYLEENKGKKDWDSSICVLVSYSFCQSLTGVGTSPCIHVLYYESQTISEDVEYDDGIADSLKKLREKLIPRLLEVSITGNSFIKSTSIVSQEKTLIPSTETDAEPVLKIVVETKNCRGMAYEMIKEACGTISEYIDWTRSSPLSVQEIFEAFGVEAAYQCILQRLVCIMEELGVSVDHAYLTLIAEFATHTGNVLGFTPSGLDEFLKSIEASAPFLQAALQQPLKKFKDAAEKRSQDPLESVVASTIWGKRPSIGTASYFKLLWAEKEVEDGTLDLMDKLDVHEFLACVPDDRQERPGTPEIVVDTDIGTCESPFLDRNYKGGDTYAWGSGTNESGEDNNGWGELSTECDGGEGTMETEASGWGVQATTGNQWGTQPGTPERGQTENEGGLQPESHLLSDSGLGTPMENQNEESGWGSVRESFQSWITTDGSGAQTSQARTEVSARNTWRKDKVSEQADPEEEGAERRKKPFAPTGANITPLGKNRFGMQFLGEDNVESPGNKKQEQDSREQTPRDGPSSKVDSPAISGKCTTSIKDGSSPHARNRKPNTLSEPRKNMDPTRRKFNMEMYRLVRTVQQIFHSYQIGDRLSEDHETFVTEKVLAHHPEYERKVGVGVDFIKVDHPPDFPDNICLFVVRKDGSAEDFSYHKCLRKFVQNTYPPEYSSLYDEQFNPKYKSKEIRAADKEPKDLIQNVVGEPGGC